MKLILIGAMVAGLWATQANACNSDLLTVIDWKVIENKKSRVLPYLLEANVKYNGDKAYRMIHAGVIFADVLGKSLGQVNLETDENVKPGDTILANGQVTVKDRMIKVNRDDVTYRTCVWAIVYQDGTKETFD